MADADRSDAGAIEPSDAATPDSAVDRAECARRLGHEFARPELLREALLHRSWQAEHGESASNERLEFLGDAVLGWVVADIAFHLMSDMPEGKLTDLRRSVVNMYALADVARGLGIGEFIMLGRGESASGGHDKESILSDTLEALFGAVYLDAGPGAAFELVRRVMMPSIVEAMPNLEMFDAKTRLQELCAQLGIGAPEYVTRGEGPDHERVFTAHVRVAGVEYAPGTGRTKKAAEQIAATRAHASLVGDA
jgi:ribonuclease-3